MPILPKQTNITDFHVSADSKYTRNHPRQKSITDAIVGIIVKDITPAHIVEKDGFQELIHVLEPKYKIVSRQHVLIPDKVQVMQERIKQCLVNVQAYAVTLDIWSSRRMHGYSVIQLLMIGSFYFAVSKCMVDKQVIAYCWNMKCDFQV